MPEQQQPPVSEILQRQTNLDCYVERPSRKGRGGPAALKKPFEDTLLSPNPDPQK